MECTLLTLERLGFTKGLLYEGREGGGGEVCLCLAGCLSNTHSSWHVEPVMFL